MNFRSQLVWGPHLWHYLHTLGATYNPDRQKEAVRRLLDSLPDLLPCKKCSKHLEEKYKNPPFHAAGRESALRSQRALAVWVTKLHDEVSSCVGGSKSGVPCVPDIVTVGTGTLLGLSVFLLVVAAVLVVARR